MLSMTLCGPVAEGFRVFVPLDKGTTGGLRRLATPCRRRRGVPRAKGDKRNCTSLQMYKPQTTDLRHWYDLGSDL